MKGIELPINVLVIVAVAVIVLLGIVALFMIGFSPFSTISGQESYKNQACTQLTRGGCTADLTSISIPFDANKDGEIASDTDNLYAMCQNYYGCNVVDDLGEDDTAANNLCCKKQCACPGY